MSRPRPHELLKAARERKDWTQEEAARKFGISQPAIVKWETEGGGFPAPAHMTLVARRYGISLDELLASIIAESEVRAALRASKPKAKSKPRKAS